MVIRFTDEFRKQYKKANKRIKKSFDERLAIFIKNPLDLQLRNHPLREEYAGQRSIDVTADWRALYTESDGKDEVIIYFTILNTHKQLYSKNKSPRI